MQGIRTPDYYESSTGLPPWKERTVLLTHNKSTLVELSILVPGMRSFPESMCYVDSRVNRADATHMDGYAGTWAQGTFQASMLQ